MRLTTLLLTVAFLQVQATTSAQTVTLTGKDLTLKEIFTAIKAQTGYLVFGKQELLESGKPVTITARNMALKEFLDLVMKDQPLTYKITGNSIALSPHPTAAFEPVVPSPSAKDTLIIISGKVTGSTGTPLSGATVTVRNSRVSVVTDAYGRFTINVSVGDVILITYVGYEPYEILITSENITKTILAQLNVVVSELDETVVIAYGTTTQRLNTGNVSTIKAKDIEKQPVTNPLLALQGRVPGLFIEQATGMPGSGVKVRIQGQSSLSDGTGTTSDPLYVIDGVPYISTMLFGISGIQGRSGTSGTGNPLSYINPADIESIEVLKDADATSIYGSRAAAGAILITTKKGKAGKTTVNFNIQNGWGQVPRFVDLLNTEQYLEMRHEALNNDGLSPRPTDYDLNGTWDTTRYTDWQKELIGGTAQYTNAQLSFSGGTSNTNFLVSGGYHRETTVFPGEMHDQKVSLHLNMNHATPNQRLKLQFNGKYLVDNNKLIGSDLTASAVRLAPVAPALYNSDRNLNWAPSSSGASTWLNPLAYLNTPYTNRVNNLIANSVISYDIIRGLQLKTNLGYTHLSRNEVLLYPLSFNSPENRSSATRFSNFGNDLLTSWIIEPQATYDINIAEGNFEVLIGATFLENSSKQLKINASGFSSDLLMENISAASTITSGGTVNAMYRYNAIFSRLNYNWRNKFIANLNVRRDGSSRFGSENLFHNFWSLGGAWIFSSESFVQQHLPALSFGKIRASYGTTGNDQIGDYRFMNLYHVRSRTVPYQGVTGLYTNSYPNPYLQWEETRKLQIGLEFGLFKDRLLANLVWYQNRSSNQLQGYALPIISGVSNITANFPATIQNSGWEVSLNSTNIQGRHFSWNTSFNITIPKNKLISYKDLEQSSSSSRFIIGQPFTIYRMYHYAGVDPSTGIYLFKDSKGNSTSNPIYPADAYFIFNNQPSLFGGVQNSLVYKSLSLDFLFQFVKQKASDSYFGDRPGNFFSGATASFGNQPITVLNRWQKQGDHSLVQKYSATYPFNLFLGSIYAQQSHMNIIDASFVRLKNLSLSWQLPLSILQKAHLQNARVFAQGQNLFTLTNYSGFDPESKSSFSLATLPPLRVWTVGVQVTL